jgi:hypothetical protein
LSFDRYRDGKYGRLRNGRSVMATNRQDNDWLNQIRRLYDEDKLKLQHEEEQRQMQARRAVDELLNRSKAHELLRQVQKALLNGAGILKVLDKTKEYDRAVVLMWHGPISAARRPDIAGEDYSYILVGVRQGKLWVNGKPISEPSPEALKVGLLEACKRPQLGRAK